MAFYLSSIGAFHSNFEKFLVHVHSLMFASNFLCSMCEFCSAAEEIEAGAEAAERRKCEKCVNHHKAVCNKREKEKGKKHLPYFGDMRKKFLENRKKRTPNLPAFVWN